MATTATDVQVPAGIPVLPGVVLSARYVLSGLEPLNKGDTLDALPLPGSRVALIVADVVGSGIGAAVSVSQVKTILRERLHSGASLLSALSSADRYARTHPDLCSTTVCIAILGLDDGEFEWATAGHPPPLWLAPGAKPEYLRTAPSRPLGAGGRPVTERIRLEVGEMVGLYTNGLVCFEGHTLSEGYDRLLGAAEKVGIAAGATSGLEAGDDLCDRVLGGVFPDQGSGDDAALLVAIRSPPPKPLSIKVAATPQNLPGIRHRTNQWLDGLGAGLVDHVGVGHAVVELAANVVAHAYRESYDADPQVNVDAYLDDEGCVQVTVSDTGRWREHVSNGRGLMMAAGLTDTMQVHRSARGTAITLTQRLTRPVPLLQQVTNGFAGEALDEPDGLQTHVEPGRLDVRGPIDDLSVDLFHSGLSEATREGTHDAVIDLSQVTHLGSVGVQALFEFWGRSSKTGSSLTLRAPAESPAGQILRLVDLPRSF